MNGKKSFGVVLVFFMILFLAASVSAKNIQCVWTSAANIRSGPGVSNEVLFVAWRYEPLTVLETKGSWVKVAEHYRDTEKKRITKGAHPKGLEGWIHKSLIKKARCLSVRTEFLNMRQGPGASYKSDWRLAWGYPLKFLQQKGSWYKVTDGKSTGWISSALVWSPWL